MPINFKITGGPSREELFDALRLYAEERCLQFILKPHSKKIRELYPTGLSVKRTCRILGITALADLPGESWSLSVTDPFGVRDLYYRTDKRIGNWHGN